VESGAVEKVVDNVTDSNTTYFALKILTGMPINLQGA